MATNRYFNQGARSEQGLYEDIVIESLKIYGQDVYYLPRDIVNEDRILGEDVPSRFNSSYKVEMYIENIDGFDGEGDLFTKFGVEIRDQATFVLARRRWAQTIQRYDNEIQAIRPLEGDLLYIPFSSKLFEITHVEHEQPFYQLQNLPTYKLRCELFEYSDEDLDTGIDAIDDIERSYAYQYELTLAEPRVATATASINNLGEVEKITLTDSGQGYGLNPIVTVSSTGSANATARALIDHTGALKSISVVNPSTGYVNPPTITISAPSTNDFVIGGNVTQIIPSGTIINGEVARWSDSDRVLGLIHVGATDGLYHPFNTYSVFDSASGAEGQVLSINENNKISENEQNTYFDTLTNFLDFSESNPFGDPS